MQYQVYHLDPLDRVLRRQTLDCGNDDDAVDRAAMGCHEPVEVWEGRRFVCRLTPKAGEAILAPRVA